MNDTYKPALFMGLLLFSAFLSACSPVASGAPVMGKTSPPSGSPAYSSSFNSPLIDTTIAPSPDNISMEDTAVVTDGGKSYDGSNAQETYGRETSDTDITDADSLLVRDATILLGESEESLIGKLGAPGRIAETEYDFDYYIYNNDYRRLLFVAVKDWTVVGFYTDSTDFSFHGVSYGSSLDTVNAAFDQSFTLSEVLTWHTGQYTVSILMDKIRTGTVTGIYLLPDEAEEDGYTDSVINGIELLVYDLTNSIRARNGVPVLSWSSSAANSSRKHSKDMAMKNFFSHTGPDHRNPGDRLKAEGIAYRSIGENIIAGYGSAILSSHGWYNSLSHRETILDKKYCSIGVGFSYQNDSNYKTYITQDFYR